MHTLHRQIFFSALLTCAAATGLFVFVLMAGAVLRELLGYVLAGQLSPAIFARMMLLLVPFVLTYALPMGVLTGVLLVLGRMSAQHEITAMRAAGLGLGYVLVPVFLLSALLAGLALPLNFSFMPHARAAYLNIRLEIVRKNPLRFIVPKTFINDFPGVVFYVGAKDGGHLQDVWIQRLDNQQRTTEFIHAREGRIDYDEQANTLQLTLQGQSQLDRRNPLDPEKFSNADYIARAETAPFPAWNLDKIFGPPRKFQQEDPDYMTFDQLRTRSRRLADLPLPADPEKARQQLHDQMKVDFSLHEKATNSLTVLVFGLMALPLGIRISRRETSANLAVALGLAMFYLLFNQGIHALQKYPALRPELLLWLPPLLLLSFAAWLFRRVGRV